MKRLLRRAIRKFNWCIVFGIISATGFFMAWSAIESMSRYELSFFDATITVIFGMIVCGAFALVAVAYQDERNYRKAQREARLYARDVARQQGAAKERARIEQDR